MLHPIAEEVRSFAEVVWVLRDKDVSVRLADALGLKYILISQAASGLIGNGIELFQNIVRCRRITRHEGIDEGVYHVGDIMADCVRKFSQIAKNRSDILERMGLQKGEYAVATVHRAENTDDPCRLRGILQGLGQLRHRVIFPIHPRTKRAIATHGLDKLLVSWSNDLPIAAAGLCAIDAVGYLDMLQLLGNAAVVLTGSGGIQKEAYFLRVPCVTLRDETEWVETVEVGWNRLVGADSQQIVEITNQCCKLRPVKRPDLYGDDHSAERITHVLGGGQLDESDVHSDSMRSMSN